MDHSSLKILRLMLVGFLLVALFGSAQATLNILGMPMSVQPVGEMMDFSMGKDKMSKDQDCDDDDDGYEGGGGDMGGGGGSNDMSTGNCLDVRPSAWTLSNMYRDQPLYMNFRPRTEEAMLVDNICYTFFPLPDDQFTYVMYSSTIYRDGSNLIESDIVTDVQLGIFRAASPYCTYKDHVLGYAGCDTFVMYRCYLSNDCRNKNSLFTFGLSQSCKQISISCLQKIEDIIQGNGIPEQDYVALPMKMPTKCVFDPVCTFKGDVETFNNVGMSQSELISPSKEVIISEIFEETIDVEIDITETKKPSKQLKEPKKAQSPPSPPKSPKQPTSQPPQKPPPQENPNYPKNNFYSRPYGGTQSGGYHQYNHYKR